MLSTVEHTSNSSDRQELPESGIRIIDQAYLDQNPNLKDPFDIANKAVSFFKKYGGELGRTITNIVAVPAREYERDFGRYFGSHFIGAREDSELSHLALLSADKPLYVSDDSVVLMPDLTTFVDEEEIRQLFLISVTNSIKSVQGSDNELIEGQVEIVLKNIQSLLEHGKAGSNLWIITGWIAGDYPELFTATEMLESYTCSFYSPFIDVETNDNGNMEASFEDVVRAGTRSSMKAYLGHVALEVAVRSSTLPDTRSRERLLRSLGERPQSPNLKPIIRSATFCGILLSIMLANRCNQAMINDALNEDDAILHYLEADRLEWTRSNLEGLARRVLEENGQDFITFSSSNKNFNVSIGTSDNEVYISFLQIVEDAPNNRLIISLSEDDFQVQIHDPQIQKAFLQYVKLNNNNILLQELRDEPEDVIAVLIALAVQINLNEILSNTEADNGSPQ